MDGMKEGQLFVRIEQLLLSRDADGANDTTYKVTCKVGAESITTTIPAYGDFEPLVFAMDTLQELYDQDLRIEVFEDETAYQTAEPRGSVCIPIKRLAIHEEVDRWFELQPPVIEHHVPGQMRLVLLVQGPYRRGFQWLLRAYGWLLAACASAMEANMAAMRALQPFMLPWMIMLPLAAWLTPLFVLTRITGQRDSVHMETEIAQRLHVHIVPRVRNATNRLMGKAVGQQMLYNTGKAPAVARVIDAVLPAEPSTRLVFSLVIDIIGLLSYFPPVIGEVFDLAWAPMHAYALHCLFLDRHPTMQRLAFLEELCMFTDIIPSATLLWIVCNQQYIIAVLRRWVWQGGMSSPEHAMHPHLHANAPY